MIVDISPATVGSAATAVAAIGKVVHWFLTRELKERDDAIAANKRANEDRCRELEGAFRAARDSEANTRKILFDKLDSLTKELHDYKLHVAETYVNESKLEKLFDPINRRLESIEKGLRDERARA